jgi:hypothetical protein
MFCSIAAWSWFVLLLPSACGDDRDFNGSSSSAGGGSTAASTGSGGTGSTAASTGSGGSGPVCGDGVIGGAEQCDDSALGGATCASVQGAGYFALPGNALACKPDCTFDTSGCTNACILDVPESLLDTCVLQ